MFKSPKLNYQGKTARQPGSAFLWDLCGGDGALPLMGVYTKEGRRPPPPELLTSQALRPAASPMAGTGRPLGCAVAYRCNEPRTLVPASVCSNAAMSLGKPVALDGASVVTTEVTA